nr:uncharacterized protein C16orf95 homolog isoform X5 [Chlorocebus sabaeus]
MDVSRNSPFQTYKKEVCLPGHSMHPGPWAVCCECQTRFGGRLPVPRVEAALPYWVPLSLRPRKQSQKMVQFYIPQTTKMCPCLCHRFGGRLPMPRDQAVMPYWVPQVLRSQQQMVRRQESLKGIQAIPGHPLPSPSEPRETSALQQTLPICQQRLSG